MKEKTRPEHYRQPCVPTQNTIATTPQSPDNRNTLATTHNIQYHEDEFCKLRNAKM